MAEYPARCIFCTATNRIIDFVPDGNDGAALVAKCTPEYGPHLVVIPTITAITR